MRESLLNPVPFLAPCRSPNASTHSFATIADRALQPRLNVSNYPSFPFIITGRRLFVCAEIQ